GPATKVFFKTLGLAPIKEVAGESQVTVVPKTIAPSIDGEAATTKKVAEVPQVTPKTTPKEEVATPTPTPTPSPSEEGKATTGGWSKLLVALSILIIAAGAAIGGYYGYEWLMLKGKDKEPPEKDSSSRW
ncbi:MAG: hypothetical protein U0946_05340, partial [Patescibacteria group bacterium]|nr:hypothetical protein [Patescibacteria group bacterium]